MLDLWFMSSLIEQEKIHFSFSSFVIHDFCMFFPFFIKLWKSAYESYCMILWLIHSHFSLKIWTLLYKVVTIFSCFSLEISLLFPFKKNILFVSIRKGWYKKACFIVVWDLFYVSKKLNLSLPSLSRASTESESEILHNHTAWFYFYVLTSCIHLTVQDKIKR